MQIREYPIDGVVVFRKTTEAFGGLSNMAGGFLLNVNELDIPSAEHLYQACRFPLFPEIQIEIIKEKSPMTAKMISRKYDRFSRQDWEQVRIKVMRWSLEVKLCQNWEKFSSVLLATGNRPIVELSHKDKIWAAIKENNKLTGVNALGRLLMELRDKFVKTNVKLDLVKPVNIPGFLLLNEEIKLVSSSSKKKHFNNDIELFELL